MRLLAAILLSLAACGAVAADADYAVVSIIGDRFTVADRDTDVRREAHQGYTFPLGSASVDGAVLAAVKEVVTERIPGARVSLALIREPAVYEAEAEVLSLSRDTQPLVDALQPVLGQIAARRLILVSKVREPVDVHFADVYKERPGVLEGLGFYLDPGARIQNAQTLERSVGYIGVFAHFRVSIVSQQTHRVLDEERVAETKAFRDERKEPWEGYTPEQKVAMIKSAVAGQIRNVLPGLLERTR
jgi:hypothetical protein